MRWYIYIYIYIYIYTYILNCWVILYVCVRVCAFLCKNFVCVRLWIQTNLRVWMHMCAVYLLKTTWFGIFCNYYLIREKSDASLSLTKWILYLYTLKIFRFIWIRILNVEEFKGISWSFKTYNRMVYKRINKDRFIRMWGFSFQYILLLYIYILNQLVRYIYIYIYIYNIYQPLRSCRIWHKVHF